MRLPFVLLLLLGPASCDTSSPGGGPDLQATLDLSAGDQAACTLRKAYSSSNAACNACAEARCCSEINACFGDLVCDDNYVNCILGCALLDGPDGGTPSASEIDACKATCAHDYPMGKLEFDAAIACADARCATECQ